MLNAQSKGALVGQAFSCSIGYMCEETPDNNPCAGLEIYLILNFSEETVSIIEKEISSCGVEHINSQLRYKWELTQDSEIKIDTNLKEIEYHFIKNLVLKIENGTVIGNKNRETFKFKKILKK